MLMNTSDVTLHFPMDYDLEQYISGLDGYPDFGGTNVTCVFDL